MSEPCTAQATIVFQDVLTFLGKLVWPVFFWASLRSKTINAHIESMLKRISRLKGYGLEAKFSPEPVKGIPSDEVESIQLTPPRPRTRG